MTHIFIKQQGDEMSELNKSCDRQTVEKFLKSRFAPITPEFIGEGWFSIAFRIGSYIVRFPKDGGTQYIHEAAVCRFIAPSLSVPVPEIQNVSDEMQYAIHRELKGRLWDGKTLLSMSVTGRANLAKDCAKFLSELHAIDRDAASREVPDLRYITDSGKDPEKCAAAFHGFLSPTQIESLISKYVAANVAKHDELVISHRDFEGCNSVLDEQGRLAGVFDWGNCGLVEPAYDLSRICIYDDTPDFTMNIIAEYNRLSGRNISETKVMKQRMISYIASSCGLAEEPCSDTARDKLMTRNISFIRTFLQQYME
ncbi:MAG: aminoglycoside phosphotransferase family protein [Alphaproteobacteria bacterium]|nr:aminoglycoside phosphotransferase family protein [Alphaproteobacteria bacterium]